MLVDSEDALPPDFGIRSQVRAGSELDGRWFSNFNWIRSDREPFSAVAFTPILGFESEHVVPKFVLRNIAPEHFDDVLSGVTYGWLNLNSALAMQLRMGSGTLLITTFRFTQYGADPYATHLLNAFIRYLASAAADPKTELPSQAAVGVTEAQQ